MEKVSPKADYTVDILTKVHDRKNRLQNGLKLRAAMLEQIKKGVKPDHYRYRFLIDAADLVHEFLIDIARQFDAQNPGDRASTLDMQDICKVVLDRFTLKVPNDKDKGKG